MIYNQQDAKQLFEAAFKVMFHTDGPIGDTVKVDSTHITKLGYFASKESPLSESCEKMLTKVQCLSELNTTVVCSEFPDKQLKLQGIRIEYDGAEYSVYYLFNTNYGAVYRSDCNTSHIVELRIIDGFQLNPNNKVVSGIIKGVGRCNGECPCHNKYKGTKDAICPCKGKVEENHVCSKLYFPVARDKASYSRKKKKK